MLAFDDHLQKCVKREGVLKGPKRDIFGSGVFAQIRPVWVGDLGTNPKKFEKFMVLA
jgi:hypothetical protein